MKITQIEVYPLWASFADAFNGPENVPESLSRPAFGMRNTPLGGQGGVIVRIHSDTGHIGTGETMGRPGARGMAALIQDVLAPMLLGQDPRAIRVHWTAMSEELRWAPMTVSGIDIALWDLIGQIQQEPVYHLLGGPFRTAVNCYASPIPYLPTPDDSATKAREFVTAGFNAIKLKIGRGIGLDSEHVTAIRQAVGPDVKLLVDANGAYTVAESVQLARELVRQGVFWLEEPVHPEFPDDLAAVRRRVDLPIATGEWLGSIYQFHELLEKDAADVLMPNITRCGGFTGMMRIADMAALKNVRIAPHGVGTGISIAAVLHAIAAIDNFLIYEYNQLFNPLRHPILTEPLHFADGVLMVPDQPGIGTGAKADVLARYHQTG